MLLDLHAHPWLPPALLLRLLREELPAEALDLLRHIRRSEKSPSPVDVSPADPLNLTGIVLPGARTGALASTAVRIIEAEKSHPGAA